MNAANRYGVPPLSLAATNGNAAILELLLKAGANPNATQSEGETALMTAARTGIPAAVKTLLAHGADVNAKESWRGQTALMWAAAEGHAETIQVLLEAGAQVNARSNAGWTALLFAAREGRIPAVKALLAGGANVDDALLARAWSRPRRWRRRSWRREARRPGGSSALVLAVGSAPLRTGGGAAGCGRESECRRAGVDGAPSPHLDSQARHRQQRSCALWLRQHGQPDARQEAEGAWRGCERESDAPPERRRLRAQLHRRDAVLHGGTRRRHGADAPPGRARRRSAAAQRGRHDAADGRCRRRHEFAWRRCGIARPKPSRP